MSTQLDMKFHLGEDWLVDFECLDADGDVINITGATTRFRLSSISGTTIMTRTESDGITITNGTLGLCSLRVTPTHQTSASVAASTRYEWEFRVVTSGGVTSVQAEGAITVKPSLF
jgi:hypothetical protein